MARRELPESATASYPDGDYRLTPRRCDPDDPNKCALPECNFLAPPGANFCPVHSGGSQQAQVRAGLYNLKRTQAAQRLLEFRDNPDSRTLATELALTRVILEEALNKWTDSYDLITNEATISRLIANVRDTLIANTKLEERYGDLINISQAVQLAQLVFDVFARHIDDKELLELIGREITQVIEKREFLSLDVEPGGES